MMKTNAFTKWMIILFACSAGGNGLSAQQAKRSNPDNLGKVACKKEGHFLGKASAHGRIISDPNDWMSSCEVIFDIWGLLGEPVYDFRFKWEKVTSIWQFPNPASCPKTSAHTGNWISRPMRITGCASPPPGAGASVESQNPVLPEFPAVSGGLSVRNLIHQ
jgi:hypothetical protein